MILLILNDANSINSNDDVDAIGNRVPLPTRPISLLGAADCYKILRVVSYKALHDSAVIDDNVYRYF